MLDETDRLILERLSWQGRASLKELAADVGLSGPSVADRLRRLEERGVIRGFTVEIDPRALGYQLEAIIRIRPLPGKLHLVKRLIEETPQIGECDKVTGDDCFFARLYLRSIEELDGILDRIAESAETSTSIVKSHTVRRRPPPLNGG